jgi:hypothetical protein
VVTAAAQAPEDATLRDLGFRAARALCAWYAAGAEPASGDGRWAAWRATLAEVAELARDRTHQPVGRWLAVQEGILARLDGRYDAAIDRLTEALPTRGTWADPQVNTNLGLAHLDRGEPGDLAAAVRHLQLARRHRARGDRAGRLVTDLALAQAYRTPGPTADEARARTHAAEAARLLHALGEPALAAAVRAGARPRPASGPAA